MRAVALLGSDVQLAVVGPASDADHLEHLRELADRLLPGRVSFLGHLDTWATLSAVDVLAVPSHLEPFGRVAVEAHRAGVPVVAADAGGLREIVTHRQDGLLFPPHDERRLAEALDELLSDVSLGRQLARAGRTSAHRYDPETHAERMLHTLGELSGAHLDSRPVSGPGQ